MIRNINSHMYMYIVYSTNKEGHSICRVYSNTVYTLVIIHVCIMYM